MIWFGSTPDPLEKTKQNKEQITFSTDFNMLSIIVSLQKPFNNMLPTDWGVKICPVFPAFEKCKQQKQGPKLFIHTNTNFDKRHTIFVLMLSPPFGNAL